MRLSFDQPLPKGQADHRHLRLRRPPHRAGGFAGLRHQVRGHPSDDFAYLMYPARWFPVSGYTTDRFSAEMNITCPRATRCWAAASIRHETAGDKNTYSSSSSSARRSPAASRW